MQDAGDAPAALLPRTGFSATDFHHLTEDPSCPSLSTIAASSYLLPAAPAASISASHMHSRAAALASRCCRVHRTTSMRRWPNLTDMEIGKASGRERWCEHG